MRATDLGFRSPKEKTAEYINPVVTFDGRFLPLLHSNKTTTFSKSKRFFQYEVEARKTGMKAGPGSYNLTHSPGDQWKIKGTPLYKDLHGSVDTSDNGYLFVGNSMQYEPSFVFTRRKSLRENISENTNREAARKSWSIAENEKSDLDTKNFSSRDSKNEGKVKNISNEPSRVKTSMPKTKRHERKLSEQFRKSPYVPSSDKKIAVKMKKFERK